MDVVPFAHWCCSLSQLGFGIRLDGKFNSKLGEMGGFPADAFNHIRSDAKYFVNSFSLNVALVANIPFVDGWFALMP